MKAIYIKPVTERVSLNTDMSVLWGEHAKTAGATVHSENVGGANEGNFFAEEEADDDYDPFFDE